MTFSLDQANLGTVVNTTPGASTFTLTTSAAAATGALICVAFGWFVASGNVITGITASGGGLTWSIPVSNGFAAGSDGCAIAYALAPAGLASSTVITFTALGAGGSFSGPVAVAQSFLGANATSPLDGTSSKAYATITSGAWSGNTISGMTGSSDLVFVCGWGDGNTGTVTVDTANTGWTGGPVASQTSAVGGCVTSLYAMNVASTPNPSPWATWGAGAPPGTAVTATAFLASGPPPPVYTQNYPSSYMKARNY